MPSRAQVFVPIVIAVIIIGIAFSFPSDVKPESDFLSDVKPESNPPIDVKPESDPPIDVKPESEEFPRGMIKLDDVLLEVQIADTKLLRARGLTFQEQLPFDQGMLLVYDSPTKRSVWMLHMQFSLDVLWINSDGKVVHIEKNIPPCKTIETGTCPTYKNKGRDAQYILEVTAGFVDKNIRRQPLDNSSSGATPLPLLAALRDASAHLTKVIDRGPT